MGGQGDHGIAARHRTRALQIEACVAPGALGISLRVFQALPRWAKLWRGSALRTTNVRRNRATSGRATRWLACVRGAIFRFKLWGEFGGREGARTPDLLVANEKLAVQDVHKVLSVQQNAFSGRKLLRAFSLAHWTLRRTPNSFCDSQNRASANRDDERPKSVGGEWHAANPNYASGAERTTRFDRPIAPRE